MSQNQQIHTASKRQLHGESGNPHIVEECRRCGKKKAKGMYFIRPTDGRHIFECDNCGRKMSMGWEEWASKQNDEALKGNDRAVSNRDRWRREHSQMYVDENMQRTDNMKPSIDPVQEFNQWMGGPGTDSEEETNDVKWGH
jgi:hypothetical protein